MTPAHRDTVHYLRIVGRRRIDVNGDELVFAVTDSLHTQSPDVDIVLLTDDFSHVRRHTGLIGL